MLRKSDLNLPLNCHYHSLSGTSALVHSGTCRNRLGSVRMSDLFICDGAWTWNVCPSSPGIMNVERAAPQSLKSRGTTLINTKNKTEPLGWGLLMNQLGRDCQFVIPPQKISFCLIVEILHCLVHSSFAHGLPYHKFTYPNRSENSEAGLSHSLSQRASQGQGLRSPVS